MKEFVAHWPERFAVAPDPWAVIVGHAARAKWQNATHKNKAAVNSVPSCSAAMQKSSIRQAETSAADAVVQHAAELPMMFRLRSKSLTSKNGNAKTNFPIKETLLRDTAQRWECKD